MVSSSVDAVDGSRGCRKRPAPVECGTLLAPFLSGAEAATRPVLDDLHARGWVAWTDDQHATLTEAGTAAHAELRWKVWHGRERLSAGLTPGVRRHHRGPAPDVGQLGWAESSLAGAACQPSGRTAVRVAGPVAARRVRPTAVRQP
jgi:hypothetical protein